MVPSIKVRGLLPPLLTVCVICYFHCYKVALDASLLTTEHGFIIQSLFLQSRGRGHDDEAIDKMLTDMSLIKKFE